jgi:hypothetical protein
MYSVIGRPSAPCTISRVRSMSDGVMPSEAVTRSLPGIKDDGAGRAAAVDHTSEQRTQAGRVARFNRTGGVGQNARGFAPGALGFDAPDLGDADGDIAAGRDERDHGHAHHQRHHHSR